jgi:hypothetical protein
VATHLAHTGLLNGEAHAAASCGIFMVLLPGTMSGISQLQVGGVGWWCDGVGRKRTAARHLLIPQLYMLPLPAGQAVPGACLL